MDLSISSSIQRKKGCKPDTIPVLLANGSFLDRTRAFSTNVRHAWLAASHACIWNNQSSPQNEDIKRLDVTRQQVEKSLSWEKHTPMIAKRPLLPRYAASSSVPLADQYSGIGFSLINSFLILEKMQEGEKIEYNLASNTLEKTLVCWKQYNAALLHRDENTEEGVNILLACLSQCESSKNEKMSLLTQLINFMPQDSDDAQILAAHAHVLGFIFEDSSRVRFDPIKFLDTAAPFFKKWISRHAQIFKDKDIQSYYHEAYQLYPKSHHSLEILGSLAIDCLWAQRGYNLLMHPSRRDAKIVIMGAFSLAWLAALIEALVAGYSVVAESRMSQIRSSSTMIRIEASSMIEALYRYGIAYPILMLCQTSNFPATINKAELKRLLYDVVVRLDRKIQAEESFSAVSFFEPQSVHFEPSKGLLEVGSHKSFSCDAMILAGSRQPERITGVSGLRLRPLEVLYGDHGQQIKVASERAFFLAGTNIAVFLVGGMEHQAVNVVRYQDSITGIRYLPLFAYHWGFPDKEVSNDVYEELCTASIERWMAQSSPFVFSVKLNRPRLTRSIFVENFLYSGLINEYQSNILRMLVALTDPLLTTSYFDKAPMENASKIFPGVIMAVCDLANPEIDALCEHLKKFITLENCLHPVSAISSRAVLGYSLIKYLESQKEFLKDLVRDDPSKSA